MAESRFPATRNLAKVLRTGLQMNLNDVRDRALGFKPSHIDSPRMQSNNALAALAEKAAFLTEVLQVVGVLLHSCRLPLSKALVHSTVPRIQSLSNGSSYPHDTYLCILPPLGGIIRLTACLPKFKQIPGNVQAYDPVGYAAKAVKLRGQEYSRMKSLCCQV